MNLIRARHGYLATVTAIVVTLIILAISIVFSSSNLLGRFDTLRFENKNISYQAAKGCISYARLKIAKGSYSGNENITVGSSTCTILPIEFGSTSTVIKSKATVGAESTNLRLTVDKTTLKTISLDEVSAF